MRPFRELEGKLPAARRGEAIELCFAPTIGVSPLRVEPTLFFQPVERGIERPFLDLQLLVGGALDPLEGGEPVHRAPRQCLEEEEIEGAANEGGGGASGEE